MSADSRPGRTGAAAAAATQTDTHSGGGAVCVWGVWQQESLEIDIAGVAEGTKAPRACACRCSSPGRAALFPGKQVSEVTEGHCGDWIPSRRAASGERRVSWLAWYSTRVAAVCVCLLCFLERAETTSVGSEG